MSRFHSLLIGIALGAAFGLVVAGPMMPTGMDCVNRVAVWGTVMSGPVVGTLYGLGGFPTGIMIGWVGALLVPSPVLRPGWFTALAAIVGLGLWFFAGFLTVMIGVWSG